MTFDFEIKLVLKNGNRRKKEKTLRTRGVKWLVIQRVNFCNGTFQRRYDSSLMLIYCIWKRGGWVYNTWASILGSRDLRRSNKNEWNGVSIRSLACLFYSSNFLNQLFRTISGIRIYRASHSSKVSRRVKRRRRGKVIQAIFPLPVPFRSLSFAIVHSGWLWRIRNWHARFTTYLVWNFFFFFFRQLQFLNQGTKVCNIFSPVCGKAFNAG